MAVTPSYTYPSNASQNTSAAPSGLDKSYATGSPVAANLPAALGAVATDLLIRDLSAFYEVRPKQFDACTALIFGKTREMIKSHVTEWWEHGRSRAPVIMGAAANAGAALSAGAYVTDTLTFTPASTTNIGKDSIIALPIVGTSNTSKVTVMTVNYSTGATLVSSAVGEAIPIVPANTELVVMGNIKADGTTDIPTVQRVTFGKRNNYLGRFYKSIRWDRLELQGWKNNGRFDVAQKDMENALIELRQDAVAHFWNMNKSVMQDASGKNTTTMGGVFPYAVAGGATNQSGVTPATLQAPFENLAMATNFDNTGSVRYIYATHQNLLLFSNIYKEQLVRYTWNDGKIDRDIDSIHIGGCTYVLVACDYFSTASAIFDAAWAKRICVVDLDNIHLCEMEGVPFFQGGPTGLKIDGLMQQDGSLKDYNQWYWEMNMTIKVPWPTRHFFINMA